MSVRGSLHLGQEVTLSGALGVVGGLKAKMDLCIIQNFISLHDSLTMLAQTNAHPRFIFQPASGSFRRRHHCLKKASGCIPRSTGRNCWYNEEIVGVAVL